MKIHQLETTLGAMTLDWLFSVFRNLEAKKKKRKEKKKSQHGGADQIAGERRSYTRVFNPPR